MEEELLGLTVTLSGIQGAVGERVREKFYEQEYRVQYCRMCICILPVSCVWGLQERLHPRASLQGKTRTLYLVLQLRSESTHTGEVSLHSTALLEESTACTSYMSAPRTAVHVIIRDSQEIAETTMFSGQHDTMGRMG